MKTNGFIKLNRKIKESFLWGVPESSFKLGIFLMMAVSFKDQKVVWAGHPVELKKGEVVTSLNELGLETGLSIMSIRTALKNLEKIGFLTRKSTNKGTRLALTSDWVSGEYGIFDSKQSNKPANTHLTSTQQTKSLRPLSSLGVNDPKNEKNEKKLKNIYGGYENKISPERLKVLESIGKVVPKI